MSINDEIVKMTSGKTISNGLSLWFSKNDAESLNDAEQRWILSSPYGISLKNVNDMWFELLTRLGYSGSLNDMKYNYWKGIGRTLNLSGTQYAKLSEPKALAGDFEVEVKLNTTEITLDSTLFDANADFILRVIKTAAGVCQLMVGDSLAWLATIGTVNVADGKDHIIKVVKTGDLYDLFIDGSLDISTTQATAVAPTIEYIGCLFDATQTFIGVIYSAKITDLATPSNSISWRLNSGVKQVIFPYDTDGTIFEPSIEFGIGADIMRADDWAVPPAGITVAGRTATFDGTQLAGDSVAANLSEVYSGLHYINQKTIVSALTGTASIDMDGTPVYRGTGDYSYINNANNLINVMEDGSLVDRFTGTVEVISIKPVPQGLIYINVSDADWT